MQLNNYKPKQLEQVSSEPVLDPTTVDSDFEQDDLPDELNFQLIANI